MRELSDSSARMTHTPRKEPLFCLILQNAAGAGMLLKNVKHLFSPTEIPSNALGDKCSEGMQPCETVCKITFSEILSRVDLQKFI